MNPLFCAERATRSPLVSARARWARRAAPWLLAAGLVPLAACEPRFGEGNTQPPRPPNQPAPGSAALPAVPGQ